MACLLLVAAPVAAQEGVGFHFAFGWQAMAGDLGEVLDGAVDSEFSVTAPVGPIRVGLGANWVSFDVHQEDRSFSQVRLHVLAAYPFRLTEVLRPYAEARYTRRRLRPEDQRFHGGPDEEGLRNFVASGYGFEAVLGTQVVLSPRAAIDVSGAMSPFSVSPDLSAEMLGAVDSGTTWRLHVGLSWFPTSGP